MPKHQLKCHVCGWIERIPGGSRQNVILETGLRPREIACIDSHTCVSAGWALALHRTRRSTSWWSWARKHPTPAAAELQCTSTTTIKVKVLFSVMMIWSSYSSEDVCDSNVSVPRTLDVNE